MRCSGSGSNVTDVSLYQLLANGKEARVDNHAQVYSHHYVNVMEAGLREALYIFRDPDSSLDTVEWNSPFECRVTNYRGSASFRFDIRVTL